MITIFKRDYNNIDWKEKSMDFSDFFDISLSF